MNPHLALLAAVSLITDPSAPPKQVMGVEILNPVWREKPSQQSVNGVYPMDAMMHEEVGTATIQCLAAATGAFSGCRIVCEYPTGYGFGRAAMAVAGAYKLFPTLPDGRSVADMTVTMPLFFSPETSMNPHRCDPPVKP